MVENAFNVMLETANNALQGIRIDVRLASLDILVISVKWFVLKSVKADAQRLEYAPSAKTDTQARTAKLYSVLTTV